MKELIKKMLIKKYAVSLDQVIPLIEKSECKVVSFDIFDTLIKRNVPTPQDVFKLLEQQYRHHFNKDICIYKLRSKAEARAVQLNGHRDVGLSEIYEAITEINDTEREWLIAEEICIEKSICQRCQPMGSVYDWCVDHNIPIILVSDMYLSHNVITELLHKTGYSAWKRLYISAEEHGNKAHGTLFDIVLHEEHLKPEKLVHIGDSLRGDYLTPKRKGIRAILAMTGALN